MSTQERTTRKSVPLSERDLRDLAVLRASATHRAALSELSGANISDSSSDAYVLHAVWQAGLEAVLDSVEEAGYAQMAAERDTATRKSVARRRRPAWADES